MPLDLSSVHTEGKFVNMAAICLRLAGWVDSVHPMLHHSPHGFDAVGMNIASHALIFAVRHGFMLEAFFGE